jgi:ribosomal protein S6--L-glutamate ligase
MDFHSVTGNGFNMVRRARGTLVEQKKEPKKEVKSKIEIIILGIDEGEGTVNDILAGVCKDLKIKCTSINVQEAWVSDQDIDKGTLTISNYDGKDSKENIKVSEAVVFVRRGAILGMTGQALTSLFETSGCFMVNDLESMLLCDNKMATAIQLASHNVVIPKTSIVNNRKSIDDAHKHIGGKFPTIIKTLTGTQGLGVAKVNDMESMVSVCEALWKYDAAILLQEWLDIDFDVRSLVVNNRILGAAKRITNKKEFRSNVHLGATTKPYILSDDEKEIILAAARATGGYMIGVDHCIDNGEIKILECNGSPGIRSKFEAYDMTAWPQKNIGPKSDKEIFTTMIDYLQFEVHRRSRFRTECGYIESIMIDGIDDPIRAKMDTGNGTTATMFHVDKLNIDGDVVHWVKNKTKFTSKIIGTSKPKHIAKMNERPIVELDIFFANKRYENVPFGLTEDDSFSEMLVNRDLLTRFKVSVNPNKRFVLSDWAERDKLPAGVIDKKKNI